MGVARRTFEGLLAQVERPGRYSGSEVGAVRKDPQAVSLRVALAFPEVYEIGQSHPGLHILYDLLNRRSDVYAERVYAPWPDLEALLRHHGHPLVSLETLTPLFEFQIVGFSLQYELTYTNLLAMLDLGGVPLRADQRREYHPLVIAGGPCAFNPEPMADFLDAVLLGDGEQAIGEICDTYLRWSGHDRQELLDALARIEGVYVPSFYAPAYAPSGRLVAVRPVRMDLPSVVQKRILRDLNGVPLTRTHVVPSIKVVHGRPNLEVMRGCVKGCRFCQAGYVYRPLRERDPRRLLRQAERAVAATGADELGLLSLSTGDYSCVNPLLTELMNSYGDQRVAVSLPSTRVDALAPVLLEQIRRVRKTSFALAPEAGSQRMRDFIQKEYTEDELLDAARRIFALGWRSLKLYFMLGLPGETDDDLMGIAELSAKVAAAGRRRGDVTASVSTFVPKPHTPFQWAQQINIAETEARQSLLRRELARRRIRFKWHDARASHLEGIFSRGGRDLGVLLLAAYRLGCRFDGWTEHCRFDLWERAFAETAIDPQEYLRHRHLGEALPWDHLSSGVNKQFLLRELARATQGRRTPDCSIERCTYCGACEFNNVRTVTYHVRGAKGGEHRGQAIDEWARATAKSGAEPGSWEPRGWQKIHCRARKEPLTISSQALAAPPASSPARCRTRLTYEKLGPARFISHLDLINVFAAACRRARLPVALSHGHRPQPRLRFSPGLALGAESDCEVLDLDLTTPIPAAKVGRLLSEELPEGLAVIDAQDISLRAPSPDRELAAFRYRIDVRSLCNGDAGTWIDRRLADFLASTNFTVCKRTGKGERLINARSLVQCIERTDSGYVEVDLAFTDAGSIKPSDLLAALLDLDPRAAQALPMRKTRAFYRRDTAPAAEATSA